MQTVIQKYKIDFSDNPVVYVNMEDISNEHLSDYQRLVKHAEKAKALSLKSAIFIDEIQEIEQFEKVFRHFQISGSKRL